MDGIVDQMTSNFLPKWVIPNLTSVLAKRVLNLIVGNTYVALKRELIAASSFLDQRIKETV